jgi:hypothetical protein
MDPKTLLLAALVIIVVFYGLFWFLTVVRRRAADGDHSSLTPQPITVAISLTRSESAPMPRRPRCFA